MILINNSAHHVYWVYDISLSDDEIVKSLIMLIIQK